jgi:Tol biopolymer transport system component
MSALRGAILVLVLMVLSAAAASSAEAVWEPQKLISKSSVEQADYAEESEISEDGRYVVFTGAIGGLQGVFRKDLTTGAIVPVAAGSEYTSALADQSRAPSISADGRYVSFTTPAPLQPAQDPQPESSDVYVADMSTTPPTYEIASALDGCDPAASPIPCGLTYENVGSVAAPGVALSADGSEVAFATVGPSNFEAGGTPERQVFLRNLTTDRTILVSVERDPLTGAMTGRPVEGGAFVESTIEPPVGASLSADGSTVAWLGADIGRQAAVAPGEPVQPSNYVEPLWRRVADGPAAQTRRVVGGPDGPYSDLNQECSTGAPTGWFSRAEVKDQLPHLSADGFTVAMVGEPDFYADLYLINMHEGLSRGQAVRRLTRALTVSSPCSNGFVANLPGAGEIRDVGISPDGEQIAFTTVRQIFPLSPPNLVGPAPARVEFAELYVLDLGAETIERVTKPLSGEGSAPLLGSEPPGATAPSFSEGGHLLAFSSSADNLVNADGNGASDVFVSEDVVVPSGPGKTSISAASVPLLPRPKWDLILSARSLPGGNVSLVAVVPGRGSVRASFAASVARRGRIKKLGVARHYTRTGGPVALRLKLPNRLRHLAHSDEGLYADASVSFHGPEGRPLKGRLVVRFHAHKARRQKGKNK